MKNGIIPQPDVQSAEGADTSQQNVLTNYTIASTPSDQWSGKPFGSTKEENVKVYKEKLFGNHIQETTDILKRWIKTRK